jgi:hypothetical protein
MAIMPTRKEKMCQSSNQINFCTPKLLCELGFSRRESTKIIDEIIKNYKEEGYLLVYAHKKVPMSYAAEWTKKNLNITISNKREQS